MAKSGPAENKSGSKSKSRQKDWIIRGVVFGVLGVLLIFALLDYFEKQHAQNTYTAWQEALQKTTEAGEELYPEDLKAITHGSPKMTEEKIQGGTIQTYSWNGMFRSYPIQVYLDMGVKPAVVEIVPPNEAAEDDSKTMPPIEKDAPAEPPAETQNSTTTEDA